jgi:type II secretory pathway pseudopilin PulG
MLASPHRKSGLTLTEAVVTTAVVLLLIALLLPAVQQVRGGRRYSCTNNLHAIGIALHNYHDMHGCFPPAYIADADGRPMHSWRVLILPLLDEQDLYARYDFNEPWNGPHNALLAAEFPTLQIYRCPEDVGTGTSYASVVGRHTCWPESKPCRIRDITDGTSNTLLVVEVHDSGIHWMEPRDLHVTQVAPTINPGGGQGISSPHEGGAYVLRAEGSVPFFSDKMPAEDLRLWLERDDGEPTPDY